MSTTLRSLLHALEGPGGFRTDLKADMESARAVAGLGTSAHAMLGSAIACCLVGLDEAGSQLLEKASIWLEEAIRHNEKGQRYSPNWSEANRYLDYAICRWLMNNEHSQDAYGSFLSYEERYLEGAPKAASDRKVAPFVITPFLDARAYGRVVSLAQSVSGFAPPRTAEDVKDEVQLCYHLSGAHDAIAGNTSRAAINRVLSRKGQEWLEHGSYIHMAEWCKIVFWENGIRSIDALRQIIPYLLP